MSEKVTLTIIEGPDHSRDADGWEHNAYTVELSYDGRAMTIPWRAGLGITAYPTAREVLECLLSDAGTVETSRGFEDWAADLGYDADSRKAERIYNTVAEQTRQLHLLLGIGLSITVMGENDTEETAKRLAAA